MIRIGVVGYVNALPLAHGLEAFLPGAEIVPGTPSCIARDLRRGHLDVGLVPVGALDPVWPRVPGLGIASWGPVRSVLLLSRVPLAEIERLVEDPASRTSNILARLWLGHHLGREVATASGPPDPARRLEQGDATVVIGEAALYLSPEPAGLRERVDLGQAWTALTGLPMVYAVWAGPRAGEPSVAKAFHDCYEHNAPRLEELATHAAGGDPGRRRLVASYLAANIVYRLGAREESGLRRFRDEAGAAGLLPAGTEEIHAGSD